MVYGNKDCLSTGVHNAAYLTLILSGAFEPLVSRQVPLASHFLLLLSHIISGPQNSIALASRHSGREALCASPYGLLKHLAIAQTFNI
jgi:hypothetical protein